MSLSSEEKHSYLEEMVFSSKEICDPSQPGIMGAHMTECQEF
jgi:hypothetical protein